MRMKQILGIALAGAVSVGAVFGSGMPVYAVAEDWLRFDADSNGSKQPDPPDEENWKMSYGYTTHPNYKYILRYCTENTRMHNKDGDGYGYDVFTYLGATKGPASVYDSTLVDLKPETNVWLTIPFSFEEAEGVLCEADDELAKTSNSIPEGEALIIYGNDVGHKWEDVMATGSIMVYDQNNNLVDTFPLQSQPADNTSTDVTATEPTDTIPAVENTADAPAVTDVTTTVQPVQTPDNSASAEAAAKEVLQGKWGVGKERQIRLEAAGYDYAEVQKQVSALMKRAS